MKMGKKFLAVNWRVVEGAAKQKKMLRLRHDEDGCFVCPVESCMHVDSSLREVYGSILTRGTIGTTISIRSQL